MSLLGLTGVGGASAEDEDWYRYDPEWPVWHQKVRQLEAGIADNEVAQAVTRVRLASLSDTYRGAIYRLFSPVGWATSLQAAENRLRILQIKRESLVDEWDRARNEVVRIETDPERERLAQLRMATRLSVGTAYPEDYGVDPSQFVFGPNIGYRVSCAAMSRDEGREDLEIGRKPIGAASREEIAEVIAGPLEGCVPNEKFNAKLIIEAMTVDRREVIATYEGTLRTYPGR